MYRAGSYRAPLRPPIRILVASHLPLQPSWLVPDSGRNSRDGLLAEVNLECFGCKGYNSRQMPITVKVKARLYPWWNYPAGAVVCVVGSAFWAWLAHLNGFSLSESRQFFFAFSGLQLFFLPLHYWANKKQFYDHDSKAKPRIVAAMVGSISLALLYFLSKHDLAAGEDVMVPTILMCASIAIGLGIVLFGIKWEIES